MSGSVKSKKRPRPSSSDIFDNLKEWILQTSPEAFVHPAVSMSTQQVRSLVVTTDIEPGTTVFMLPLREQLFADDDTELAWSLASSSTKELLQPYLDSLPATIDLPRFWSQRGGLTAEQLLQGSPVLQRVQQQQEAVERDYERLRKIAKQQPVESIPSFGDFNYAMAVVTSRAFCRSNCSNNPAMVPLLDFCNHHRGWGGGSSQQKNLSYTFHTTDSGWTTVHVKAVTLIAAHDVLRITYGAQGNAPLLLNYGFCLDHNLEPDGSSNDTFELQLNDTTIFLRTGPKSYTYGCWIKALEACMRLVADSSLLQRSEPKNEDNDGNYSGIPDDMESFLDACDAEQDDEEEDVDCAVCQIGGELEGDSEETKTLELDALGRLRVILCDCVGAYKLQNDKLQESLNTAKDASPEKYAGLLIKSELRTLQFYISAIAAVKKKLGKGEVEDPVCLVNLEVSDTELIGKQVEELAVAYMQIRHSDLMGFA